MNSKSESKKLILKALRTVCNTVHSTFIDPESAYDQCGEFPAIFIEETGSKPHPGAGKRSFVLSLTLYCVVKSNDDEVLSVLRDEFEDKVFSALNNHVDGLGVLVERTQSSNLKSDRVFAAGINRPYATFAVECFVPFSRA